MEAFTLFELNEHIRRVIALNFEAPVWVKCEISQIKESRGQFYLELVQKDEQTDEVVAHASAAIWSRNYGFIKKKHGQITDDLLKDGVALKFVDGAPAIRDDLAHLGEIFVDGFDQFNGRQGF